MFGVWAVFAAASFLSHIFLLIASFSSTGFKRKRYFWSHATLLLTGVFIFVLAISYAGKNQSVVIDYFDSPIKKSMILLITCIVSLTAHIFVKRFILSVYKVEKLW